MRNIRFAVCALALPCLSLAAEAQNIFGPNQVYSTGGHVTGIVAADFDGDGDFDVAGSRQTSVAILWNDGAGALSAPASVTVGVNNRDLCTGDFDRDGDPDLALASLSTADVKILLNDGTGNFIAAGAHGISSAEWVHAGDQDGDGILDLAVLSSVATIHVLRGDGSGAFAPVGMVTLGVGVPDISDFLFRDVDGDGLADLIAFAHQSLAIDRIRVHLATGPGTFVLHQDFPAEPFATVHAGVLGLGDVDGDLDLDLLSARGPSTSSILRTYFNDGSAAFSLSPTTVLLGKDARSITCANLDTVPISDALISLQDGLMRVLPGTASFPQMVQTYPSLWNSTHTQLVDMDGDGWLDFVGGGSPFLSHDDGVGVALNILPHLAPPTTYCEAKLNSLGCLPTISSSGFPSYSGPDDFVVSARRSRNGKPGKLLWSLSASSTPFLGGTLCLGAPLMRTADQLAGGTPAPAQDCTGTYAFPFAQSYLAANSIPPGTQVYSQYYMRDNGFAPPNNVGLSNALSFTVDP